MKLKLITLAALSAPLFGAYQYYYTDSLTSIDAGKWTQNGLPVATPGGLSATDANGGSLISTVAVPDSTADYEVAATLKLAASGGTYILYLRASSDTLSGSSTSVGSYFSVEVENPTCVTPSNCAAMVYVYKRISTHVTLLSYNPMPIHNGSMVRAAVSGGSLFVTVDGLFTCWFADGDLSGGVGQPGIGGRQMPAGNRISLVQLGLIDRVAPLAVSSNSIGVTAFPTCVELQWQGASDGTNGIGIQRYDIHRGSDIIAVVYPAAAEDCTVTADGTYTYTIVPIDFHNNYGPGTSFTVRTPAAGAIDPRRVGVKALGTYWGGMGEQIDTRSGNLNYTLPLLSAQGRGGWAVPFALSYNSQMWRKDAGGTWNLGKDVGFGFGWRLLAGSITPYWYGYFGVDHYVFTDSTGAEYRLELNNNNVWTSKQGTYVSYDANSHTLYFPDGSFWTMGCTSTGNEDDAGTLYPTQMTDTNGNIVALRYAAGIGALWSNSSARLLQIEDVRAVQTGTDWVTYQFTYDYVTLTDLFPHLTGIEPKVASPEGATLRYIAQSLFDPFLGTPYGSTYVLGTFVNYLNLDQTFSYDTSGELTQANLPYGGILNWGYNTSTYIGSRSQREVRVRLLQKGPGEAQTAHTFNWDTGDPSRPVHTVAILDDSGSNSQKVWSFDATMGTNWWNGVLNQYQELSAWSKCLKNQTFTWDLGPSSTPYIKATNTTLDYNTTDAKTTRSEQTVDVHGNVLTTSVYQYGAGNQPGALLRTYSNTYLSGSNYTSRYIFNRLTSSIVSTGSSSVETVHNQYDEYGSWPGLTDLTNPAPREHDTSYNTSYYYRGNVTTQTTPVKTVTRGFDITGNIKSATDGNLNVSATTGSATNYAAPSSITSNSNSNLTSNYTFNGNLDLTGVTMPNGATWGQNYYAYGMPLSTTSPTLAVTNYSYNFNSNASTVTATTNGHWVRSTMDGLGRTIKVEKGDGSETKSVTQSEYAPCACSPMGKVKKVSQPHGPNAPVLWTEYTYDALGRTVKIVKPDSSTTTYSYAGNTTTVIDAVGNGTAASDKAGHWKMFTTDPLGNLTQVTEPDPAVTPLPALPPSNLADCGTASNVYHKTCYSYNLLNKLTEVKMPRGTTSQLRTFTYDKSGQGALVMSARNPENGLVSYTYNSDGTLANRTDNLGHLTQYSYDNYQRLTRVHRFDGSEDVYTYDTYSTTGFTSQNAWGRLAAVTFQGQPDPNNGTVGTSFAYMYSYTAAGLVTAKRLRLTRGTPTADLEADYTWDTEGRMTSVTYPTTGQYPNYIAGPTYSYGYNSMGQLNTMSQTAGPRYNPGNLALPLTMVSGANYGAAGELLSITGGGSSGYMGETRSYNSLFQVLTISAPQFDGPGVQVQYTYLNGTNIGKIDTQKILVNNGGVQSQEEVQYRYDALGRMISAETTAASQGTVWGYSYGYDGYGNLGSKVVTKGTPSAGFGVGSDAANHLIGYSYDGNGNMTGQGSYSYDAENRLIQYGESEKYGYDPSNKRIQKQFADGTEEIHFYGAAGEHLGVYALNANGYPYNMISFTVQTLNFYFGGKRLGRVSQSGNTSFASLDRLGSEGPSNLYPWGEEKQASAQQNTERFATYYRDQGSGLDYADQRYYASVSGRFMTPDPADAGDLDDPQSLNLYTYAANDPVNFNDPEGTTVNIPLEDGGSSTDCLNYKVMPWVKSHGFSIDDNFNDFASTGVGTLGITLYYESTSGSTQLYQQMAQVMANRYWMANSDPAQAKKLGLPVWGSAQKTKDSRVSYIAMHTSQDWDSKGNLKAIKDLEHILFGEVAASWAGTNRANCDHLISALNVAYDANRTSFATRGSKLPGTYLDTYWFYQGLKNDPVNHNYWNAVNVPFQGWYFERLIGPKVPKKK